MNLPDVSLIAFNQLSPAEAVIVAVAHRHYRELKPDQLKALTNGNSLVMDVKGIYERQALEPPGSVSGGSK
ncbi:MAG: hypothetical protein A4E71_02953 [Smithella sp. PtaU1.Bin162]|nr:MAG: hypothetical protein A4E71_02953 [Smithella sp. PtaU1.Bin162]